MSFLPLHPFAAPSCAEQHAFARAYRRQAPLLAGVALWLCLVSFAVLGRWPGNLLGVLLVVLCAAAPAWLALGPARLQAQLAACQAPVDSTPRLHPLQRSRTLL